MASSSASRAPAAAAPAAVPKTYMLHVYLKAEDAPADVVHVEHAKLPRLKEILAEKFHARLRKHYSAEKEWQVLTFRSDPVDMRMLKKEDTLLLGRPNEKLVANPKVRVHHKPHHNVMTDSSVHFHDAGGKKPARLLFCEFIDNSLEALRRMWAANEKDPYPKSTIEIHLIYGKYTKGEGRWSDHQLSHIVVLDRGPGMTQEQLKQWAEMANPTAARRDALGKKALGEWPADACHADGQLGRFGVGSKKAAFYYGDSVRAVTSHREGFRKAGPHSNLVYELLLSKDEFQQRQQSSAETGEDWTANDVLMRTAFLSGDEEARARFEQMRSEEERRCSYLTELMQRVEEEGKSFTLFVISQINKKAKADLPHKSKEVEQSPLLDLVRELRDLYFVYTDGLETAIKPKLQLDEMEQPPPEMQFHYKYGRVDLQLFAVKLDTPTVGQYQTIMHKSLRSDSEGDGMAGPLLLPPPIASPTFDEATGAATFEVDRLSKLFELAASSLFRFRIVHAELGHLEGMVLYLPCEGGSERIKQVSLHEGSRALIFWKGRLIPYAKLTSLLPFMSWQAKKGERLRPDELQMQERTVLILFMDGVTPVDQTKFHVSDDLALKLARYPPVGSQLNTSSAEFNPSHQFHFAWFFDNEQRKWEAAPADLTNVVVPQSQQAVVGRAGRGLSLREKFKEWNEECHINFDKIVQLSGRVATRRCCETSVSAGGRASAQPQTELTFEDQHEDDPWKKLIQTADASGLIRMGGCFPSQILDNSLVFFDKLTLGPRLSYSSRQNDTTFRIDLAKATAGQGEALTPPFHSNGARHKTMLAKVVSFFIEWDEEHRAGLTKGDRAIDRGKPTEYKGPTCHCLVRRMPPDLFGGLYIVSSAALEGLDAVKLREEEKKLYDSAPARLVAFFQTVGVDHETAGSGRESPLRVRADEAFPNVVVQPIAERGKVQQGGTSAAARGYAESGTIVVNWTNDRGWLRSTHTALEVTQSMSREGAVETDRVTAAAGSSKWMDDKFDVKNAQGDAKKGFVFWGREMRMPEPGLYKLTYSLPPLRSATERAAGSRAAAASKTAAARGLMVELWLQVEASRPRAFTMEKLRDVPLSLGAKMEPYFKMVCLGQDDKPVQLTEDVMKAQIKLLKKAITAQTTLKRMDINIPELITVDHAEYAIDGTIDVGEASRKALSLGCTFKIRLTAKCEGESEAAMAYQTGKWPSGDLCEDPPPEYARFWRNEPRNAPRTLTLKLFLMGCKICTVPSGYETSAGTYIQFNKRALGADDDIFMYHSPKLKASGWETFPGPLPPDFEHIEFFESGSQMRNLELKVISGGSTRMVLSGPLADKQLREEPTPSLSIENHATLPKLVVQMMDAHGGYVPGAPGDMVRVAWPGAPPELAKLGPNGKADFDFLALAIPSEALKASLQGTDGAEQRVRHYLEVTIDAFNETEGGAASTAPIQGADGSLKELSALKRYLTVVPSMVPRRLVLFRDDVAVPLDADGGADDEMPATALISDEAGLELKGLQLRATNEVGTHIGPPFHQDLIKLFVGGEEITFNPQDPFLLRGTLPEYTPKGEVPSFQLPSALKDGAKTVAIELHVLESAGHGARARASTGAKYHKTELRVRLTPLAGKPKRWALFRRGGGAAVAEVTSLDLSVDDALEGAVRVVALDEHGNHCAPPHGPQGAALVPSISIRGAASEHDDDAMTDDEEARTVPYFVSAAGAGAGDGSGIKRRLPLGAEEADAPGGSGGAQRRSASSQRRHQTAESGGFRLCSAARVHGPVGQFALCVSDANGTLEAAAVPLKLLPGAPVSLALRAASATVLKAPTATGSRRCVGDKQVSFSVLDVAKNEVPVQELHLSDPEIVRLEPSDASVPLVKLWLQTPLTKADGGRRHVCEVARIRFDRLLERGSGRPLKQKQQVTFRATAKHQGKSVRVSAEPIVLEASEVLSQIVEGFVLTGEGVTEMWRAIGGGTGDAAGGTAAPPLVLPANTEFPSVEVAFDLENGDRVTQDQLLGGGAAAADDAATAATAPAAGGKRTRSEALDAGKSPAAAGLAEAHSPEPSLGSALSQMVSRSTRHSAEAAAASPASTAAGQPREPAAEEPSGDPAARSGLRCGLTLTLQLPPENKRAAVKVELEPLGHGKYALPEGHDALCKAGEYELQGRYEETRRAFREALAALPALGWAAEASLPPVAQPPRALLRFRVRPGPAAVVFLTSRNKVTSCNNTNKLVALQPSNLEIMDEFGNLTSAPAGVRVQLSYTLMAGSDAQPPSAATALALTQVPLSLPPAAPFDSNGVAKLELAQVRPGEGGADCVIHFAFALVGWPEAEGPPPTLPDPLRVTFEDTASLEEQRRREKERLALLNEQRDQLQREHTTDAERHATAAQARVTQRMDHKTILDSMVAGITNFLGAPVERLVHVPPTSVESMSPLVRRAETELQRRGAARFDAQRGLSRAEEDLLNEWSGDCLGTVADLFELNVDARYWSAEEARTLAAVLADYLKDECLKMAIVKTKNCATAILRNSSLRVFSLDMNADRQYQRTPDMLREFEQQHSGVRLQCAASLVGVRPECVQAWAVRAGGNQAVAKMTEQKVLEKVLGATPLANLVIATCQKDALDYQQLLTQRRRKNPAMLCLDGFKLSGQGFMGGRNAKCKTSLAQLGPHSPHFGYDGGFDESQLSQFRAELAKGLEGMRIAEEQIVSQNKQALLLRKSMDERQEHVRAQGLGSPLSEEVQMALPAAAAGRVLPPPGAEYALRHRSRTADEAAMQQQQAAKRPNLRGASSSVHGLH